jgi:predicted DNA binding CopG/RHH family protein
MEVRQARQARTNALQPVREGYVPQGPALNIRLSSKDLEAIQKRALAEGLPYQTLIASLLHKYATGRLKEI